ncbi:DNA-methyltransferase [uncultured Allofournierella sp.]|uniref:DNA-methyltransferase n=1 Tax=uncultured Allofournierella sp. TaxID=1940258 RepID=UPI003753CC62
MENYKNKIYNMDCIAGMAMLPDGCVDMALTDLPYGTTDGHWDTLIPFDALWQQLNRVVKPNGAIVMTVAQPFTTKLINSNPKAFRYCWYWFKNQVTGFPFAKVQPLRCVEEVVVFYRKKPTYNPQGLVALEKPRRVPGKKLNDAHIYRTGGLEKESVQRFTNYPRQVLTIPCQRDGLHPTQKPVALFEYLVRTYTEPGQLVLDCCMGSGTKAVACQNAGRQYVGFEINEEFYKTAIARLT